MSDYRGGGRGGSGYGRSRGGYSGERGGGSFPSGRGGFRGGRGGGGGGFGADQNISMPMAGSHQNVVTQKLSHGTEGRPIELLANYYKLTTPEKQVVYHYDIDIKRERTERTPDISSLRFGESSSPPPSPSSTDSTSSTDSKTDRFVIKFADQVIKRMIAVCPVFANVPNVHDGQKNLYTTRELNFEGKNSISVAVRIDIDGLPTDFIVKVKRAGSVPVKDVIEYYARRKDFLSEKVVTVFEIILRFIMGKHYVTFQRKLFDLNSITGSPKVQLAEFISGFTSAVRMTEFGLALNVHLKTSCVISRTITKVSDLAEMVAGIRIGQRPSRQQIMDFSRFIRHLKVFTNHSKREVTYTADGLVDKTPEDIRFPCKKVGHDITIAEHFRNEYGIVTKPDTVMLKMTKRGCYLPLEHCYLMPNQFLSNAKINTQIQRELLLKATNTPNVYFNKLGKVVEKVAASEPALQQDFGVTIDTSPVSFMGRVLNAPQLLNSNRNDKFNTAGKVPARWGVFCFDTNISQEQLEGFVGMMRDRARYFGLPLEKPHPVALVSIQDAETIHNVFSNLQAKSHAQFVFIGIPTRHVKISPSHMYGLSKYYCDKEHGIPSQCFKAEYISKLPSGYFDQFLLKVNAKCGGRNSIVDPRQLSSIPFNMSRTMFVGVDVNHPAETEKVASSVSAAVGSLDSTFSQYTASIRVQKKNREEILYNIDEMITELLKEYLKVNEALPENLIIFRDGVSEGQYKEVSESELVSIEKGIKATTKSHINITLIIVQKRHNTRFALTNVNTRGHKPTWNVPSGTVVDNTIVEPLYKTFYLNSHFSPLGTSRPTKYVILRDDLKMTADTLQRMVFLLCHNSVRTRGVIAIPTPVRYADLCCYRSKLHIEAMRNLVDTNTNTTGRTTQSERERIEEEIIKQLNGLVQLDQNYRNQLYYC